MTCCQEELTVGEHLEELRWTLMKILGTVGAGFLLAFLFHRLLLQFLLYPLGGGSNELVVLGPIDGLLTVLKTSLWFSMAFTSPLWIYFLFQFITPAFHGNERRLFIPFGLISLAFLILGVLFAYLVMIPIANAFFLEFNAGLGQNLWTLSDYLDYTVILLLGSVIAFEFGALTFLVVHFRIVSAETLERGRKGVILGIFILSALLTPPDIVTQLMMAIPLTLLFEGTLLYGKWRESKNGSRRR